MLYFKACPRCKGDMHPNRDIYGDYRECLQCGHMVDIERADPLLSMAVPRGKKSLGRSKKAA